MVGTYMLFDSCIYVLPKSRSFRLTCTMLLVVEVVFWSYQFDRSHIRQSVWISYFLISKRSSTYWETVGLLWRVWSFCGRDRTTFKPSDRAIFSSCYVKEWKLAFCVSNILRSPAVILCRHISRKKSMIRLIHHITIITIDSKVLFVYNLGSLSTKVISSPNFLANLSLMFK